VRCGVFARAICVWGRRPVSEGRHGEGLAEFVENEAFVVEEEGEGGGAWGDLSEGVGGEGNWSVGGNGNGDSDDDAAAAA
jgi:hypothetical protein